MNEIFDKYDRKHLVDNTHTIINQINRLYDDLVNNFSVVASRYKYIDSLSLAQQKNVWFRNSDIEKFIDSYLEKFSNDIRIRIRNNIAASWSLAEEKNDSILIESLKIAGITGATIIGSKAIYDWFNRVSPEVVSKHSGITLDDVLATPRQAKGVDKFILSRKIKLSERVWDLSRGSKQMIEELLQNGILRGDSASEIGITLRKYLVNPDVFYRKIRNPETGKLELSANAKAFHPGQGVARSPRLNTIRLVANEVNIAYRTADHLRWQQNPMVVGFNVSVTGTHITDMCDELEGDYPKDFIFTGWHVLCRCIAKAILISREEMKYYIHSILKDEEPKVVNSLNQVKDVPEGFKMWVEKNAERVSGWKSQPYWVQDNFKDGVISGGLQLKNKVL
jgi:hypothetical protein